MFVRDIGDDRDDHIQALEDKVDRLETELANAELKLSKKTENVDYKEAYETVLKNFHQLLDETIPFLSS